MSMPFHRWLLSLIISLLMVATAVAQPEQEVRTQDIYAVLLENKPLKTQLYYRNVDGEYTPFQVSLASRGSPNTQIFGERLVLYAEAIDEMGNEFMKPVRTFELPASERVMILFYGQKDGSIAHRAIDDSVEAHPVNTGRIINLTPLKAVCKIGDQQFTLSPWQEVLSNSIPNSDEGFSFAYIFEIDGEYQEFPLTKRFRFPRPNKRMLAVFTFFTHEEEAVTGDDTTEVVRTYRLPKAHIMDDRVPTADEPIGQQAGVQRL